LPSKGGSREVLEMRQPASMRRSRPARPPAPGSAPRAAHRATA